MINLKEYTTVDSYSFLFQNYVVHVGGASLICSRRENQDALIAIDNCFAVADGIGGGSDGKFAAQVAMKTVEEDGAVQWNGEFSFLMEGIFQAANRTIYRWKEEQVKANKEIRVRNFL